MEVETECPDTTWGAFGGKCFKSIDSSTNMAECLESCACKGATLACPTSAEVNAFIQNHVKKTPSTLGWLGLSDYFLEGTWQCISEEQPDEVSFENWDNPGENHRYDPDNKYQNCAVMNDDGEWTSESCDWFDSDFGDSDPECICERGATKTVFVGLLSKTLRESWEEEWEDWFEEKDEWIDEWDEDNDCDDKDEDDRDEDEDCRRRGRRDRKDDDVGVAFMIGFFGFFISIVICSGFLCYRRMANTAKIQVAQISQRQRQAPSGGFEMTTINSQPRQTVLLGGGMPRPSISAPFNGPSPPAAASGASTGLAAPAAGAAGVAGASGATGLYTPLRDDIPYAKAEYHS